MWRKLLADAVAANSQAVVARELGFSPSTISRVLSGNYGASLDAIRQQTIKTYGDQAMQAELVPEGYKRNAVGYLVPVERVKEVDLMRDQFVADVIARARAISEVVADFKAHLAADLQAFLELSAEKYQAKLGSGRGNVTLTSFDGRYQILRAVSDQITFDERLQSAKALIDDCLHIWTKDSGSEIQALIEHAFQTDRQGKINTKRILGLRQLKIDDETWLRAMEAIADAVTITGSRTYFRIYERDERGKYVQIPLDFSGA